MLCKYIVLSFPAGIEKLKTAFFFSPFLPPVPFHFGISAEFSQKHIPCRGSLTVHCYLSSVRIQEAGERSQANSISAFFFMYVQSFLE